jgi:tetratricopeptide (TPR) repeat protein
MSEFDLWSEIGTIYEDEAANAHQKVMELNRRFLNHWLRLGSVFEKKQKRQEAVQAYRRALELNGRSARIWNELANVYFNAGAYEDAVDAYLKAIELEPGYGWPYSNLGLAYTCLGRDGEALPLHLKAVELLEQAEERGMVWNRLGNAYRRVSEYENAAHAYRMADELAPGKTDFRGDLGEIHNELFFTEDAVSEERPAAITSEPLPSEHWLSASLSETEENLFGLGDEKAPEAVEQAEPLELGGPKLQTAFETREETPAPQAEETIVAEQPSEPVSMPATDEPAPAPVEQPLAASATEPEAQPAAEEQTDPEAEAEVEVPVAQAAVAIPEATPAATAPEMPELAGMNDAQIARVWNDVGDIYTGAEADAEAIDAYRKALDLDPYFGWPYSNLATIYVRQGRYLEAIRLYQRSIELLNDARDVATVWKKLIEATIAYRNSGTAQVGNSVQEPLG